MMAQSGLTFVQPTALGEKAGQIRSIQVHPNRLAAGRRRQAVETLLAACAGEREHAHHVAHLSLRLFDELQELHHMGASERLWLEEASLLHDIGTIDGEHSHHKSTLRIILMTPMLPFSSRERLIVGSIARYHRKALPSLEHDHFRALYPATRAIVSSLAAILRVVEGLDSDHLCQVRDLTCRIRSSKVVVDYRSQSGEPVDCQAAEARSDLFEQAFARRLVFRLHEETD
jgi:exopolyphosphatase/guanosine-5'-triphosphate,3'-diphosphate pyrophosphatase